jgi:hypothetical protein
MNDEEVIAAMRQWVEKAVIGLNLCPFAKSVYVKNQVRFVVSQAKHLDGFLEDLDRELDLLAEADPAEIDTTLLIHPTLLPDFLDFNDFTIIAEAAVEEHGLEGVIQVASFHPRFQFADTEPDDIQLHQSSAVSDAASDSGSQSGKGGGGFPTRKRSSAAISKPCKNWVWPAGARWVSQRMLDKTG